MRKKKENRFLGEKGSISYFIVFVFLAFILLVLFVFITPVLIKFNTELYAAGEDILLDANSTASSLSNAQVRGQLQDSLTAASGSIPTQIDVLSNFFQYAWILIIVIIVLALYMFTRETVEGEIR